MTPRRTSPRTSRKSSSRPKRSTGWHRPRAKSAQLAKPVGKRLELVPRKGPRADRADINVRFASKEQHAAVKAAAKKANESMSQFMAKAALERAATVSDHTVPAIVRAMPVEPAV